MARALFFVAAAAACCLSAQPAAPQTDREFDCYVQSAEARMAARQPLQTADAMRNIQTVPGNGPNPHKIPGAMIYDWIGTIFIPGATVDRTIHMLQDYDHRPLYFPETISNARLLCREGENRFGFSMRLKEPAVIDSENDVVWERLDARHWRCRSYSTQVHEIGKQHNYLLRLNSYWRFAETGRGVLVEGQAITLSGEFGSLMRTLGSLAGINPEKSLKKTLASMRESLEKPGLQFSAPPANIAACGPPVAAPACSLQSRR
jgi:hypothetical protein